jgi:Phytanoyl-CoA dioxygenase (PhyH)
VAGRIDDVDPGLVALMIIPLNAGALGKNRDSAFFFKIVRIHRPLFNALVVAEGSGLAEKLVNKSGFAMIDVGDDSDITQRHLDLGLLGGRFGSNTPPDSRAPLTEFVRCGKDCYATQMYEFERDGLSYCPNACSFDELESIESALATVASDAAGIRLHGIPALIAPLSAAGCIGRVAATLIGQDAHPVRAILFDKNEATNWALGWHQDRTIVVRERVEVSGFGPWTTKAGLQHVAPPIKVLEEMVTLRLHLDPVLADNAPLMVAMGSHRLGRIAEQDIATIIRVSETFVCLAERGDIWAYSTPILHASEPSSNPTHRRVLQVDYATTPLAGGLQWLGI